MLASTQTMTWKTVLAGEKEKEYFKKAMEFVKAECAKGKKIYPPQNEIFNAIKLTPYEDVRVVIIGQDPYHGPGQAHGLCFSVKPGVPAPPSLKNIYQELHDDVGFEIPNDGYLEKWAKQGVLLLNATLTVEASKPNSHANIGWQQFTDKIIDSLNSHPKPIVFLLWGSFAQRKGQNINTGKHFILKCPHPSPLSAHRGFLGCRHFSKANAILKKNGRKEIDWQL